VKGSKPFRSLLSPEKKSAMTQGVEMRLQASNTSVQVKHQTPNLDRRFTPST